MSKSWKQGSTWAWRKRRAQALARDGYRCMMQTEHCTLYAVEVDHITPRSLGGTDDLDNLRSVCAACHDTRTINNDPELETRTQW